MQDFQNLKKGDVISLFLRHCQRKTYQAKQLIITEGDLSKELYYIVHGSVTVLIEDHKSREFILDYLNAGEFFGEIGLFEQVQYRSAFVRTKSKCEIARISYEELKNLQVILPDLLFYIAGQMAARLIKASHKVKDLAFTDVKGRIARAMLDLCKDPDAMTHPDGMQIKITRKELGRVVGCSRETVGRILKGMEEEQLISISGKTIVVFGRR